MRGLHLAPTAKPGIFLATLRGRSLLISITSVSYGATYAIEEERTDAELESALARFNPRKLAKLAQEAAP